jgi:hypothetical protein
VGRIIREELEPIFVDIEGEVRPDLGPRLYLGSNLPQREPNRDTLATIQSRIATLQQAAENHIRAQYQEYYQRVERKRDEDIEILREDLERFDRGVMVDLEARLTATRSQQGQLFDDAALKGQRTRIENQIATHRHRMSERRSEVEEMRVGAFPAPQLFNMVIVTPT